MIRHVTSTGSRLSVCLIFAAFVLFLVAGCDSSGGGAGGTEENSPPSASFTVEPSGEIQAGTEVTFDASASSDTDGEISLYEWTIDGTEKTGPTVTHTFEEPGDYTVRLTVSDDDGLEGSTSKTVAVGQPNSAPNASIAMRLARYDRGYGGSDPRVWIEQPLFDASGSSDPDGGDLDYAWTVGGRAAPALSGSEKITALFHTPGEVEVEVTVTDQEGLTATAATTVNVQSIVKGPPYSDDLIELFQEMTMTKESAGTGVLEEGEAFGLGSFIKRFRPGSLAQLSFGGNTRKGLPPDGSFIGIQTVADVVDFMVDEDFETPFYEKNRSTPGIQTSYMSQSTIKGIAGFVSSEDGSNITAFTRTNDANSSIGASIMRIPKKGERAFPLATQRKIAAHEAIHAFGFGHPRPSDDMMISLYGNGTTDYLTEKDLVLLEMLYRPELGQEEPVLVSGDPECYYGMDCEPAVYEFDDPITVREASEILSSLTAADGKVESVGLSPAGRDGVLPEEAAPGALGSSGEHFEGDFGLYRTGDRDVRRVYAD